MRQVALLIVLAGSWGSALGTLAVHAAPGPSRVARHLAPHTRAIFRREANRRFRKGLSAYQKGDYEGALRLFQAAAELLYRPVQSYNIALCYEKIGNAEQAVLHLRRYLETKPPRNRAKLARDRIAHLMKIVKVAVKVTSFPTGAALYVDGHGRGLRGRTPFTIPLRPGPHTLEVRAGGYVPTTRRIHVKVGGRNYHDFQLRRQSALRISTSVAGARVFLDNENAAHAALAPVNRVVAPGRHRIKVVRPGYFPVTRHVDVRAGDQVSLFVDLRPMPRHGLLRVESNVSGASVRVEQEELGQTPLQGHRLQVGTYRIYVHKKGYQTWERRVTIAYNQITLVRVQLSRVTSRRQLAWFVSGTVTTGLLLAGGLVMSLTASNAQEEYRSLPRAQLRRDGRTYALAADVLFATGAIFGIVTGFVTWRLKPAPSRGTVVPLVGPGFAGISYGRRF